MLTLALKKAYIKNGKLSPICILSNKDAIKPHTKEMFGVMRSASVIHGSVTGIRKIVSKGSGKRHILEINILRTNVSTIML